MMHCKTQLLNIYILMAIFIFRKVKFFYKVSFNSSKPMTNIVCYHAVQQKKYFKIHNVLQ